MTTHPSGARYSLSLRSNTGLPGANVKTLKVDVVGYLGDDPGFADAACTSSMPTERICMSMILLEPANKIAYPQRSIKLRTISLVGLFSKFDSQLAIGSSNNA